MKLKAPVLLILTVIILFSSCTLEPRTDIFGFCRRMNKAEAGVTLDDTAFYYDGEEYSTFINLSGCECILALSTDAEACVESLRLTALNTESSLDEAKQNAVFTYCVGLFSVLTNRPKEEITALLSDNSVDASAVSFTENSVEIEQEKYCLFLFTNTQLISFYCTLN